jgi:hypothetical protein
MKTLLALLLILSNTMHAGSAPTDASMSPNSRVTPGAINSAVTQSNIHQTICVSGYTATIRPPSSYTTALKVQQLHNGYAVAGDMKTSDYEEDHLISLELGGAPSDPKNLWPEYYNSSLGARVKDRVENALHSLVCKGIIKLKTAQKLIANDWRGAYSKFIGSLPKFSLFKKKSSTGAVPSGGSSGKTDPRFATCKAANAAGYGPYYRGTNVEYGWYRDANTDGKVC